MLLRVIVMTRATHGRCCNMSIETMSYCRADGWPIDQRYGFTLVRLSHLGLWDRGSSQSRDRAHRSSRPPMNSGLLALLCVLCASDRTL